MPRCHQWAPAWFIGSVITTRCDTTHTHRVRDSRSVNPDLADIGYCPRRTQDSRRAQDPRALSMAYQQDYGTQAVWSLATQPDARRPLAQCRVSSTRPRPTRGIAGAAG